MKMNHKKTMAMLLVGMMAFGSAAVAMTNVSEAHHREHRQETYADGTTNKYSHRMHEEETTHRMNLRALRYQHRKGEISDKEYNKRMKEEQKRHDREMQNIKSEYEAHNPHKSK